MGTPRKGRGGAVLKGRWTCRILTTQPGHPGPGFSAHLPGGGGSPSLQGSDGLQHVLQLATLVQVRHIAASSHALVANEHPRHLRARLETERLQKVQKDRLKANHGQLHGARASQVWACLERLIKACRHLEDWDRTPTPPRHTHGRCQIVESPVEGELCTSWLRHQISAPSTS